MDSVKVKSLLLRVIHNFFTLTPTILIIVLIIGMCSVNHSFAQNTISLEQACYLVQIDHDELNLLKSKIAMNRVKYVEAMRAIKEKKKNLSTFRWSPLLSFKFPQDPNLTEAYDFQYKPMQIDAELTSLQHELAYKVHSIQDQTAQIYLTIFSSQEKIAFKERQLSDLKEEVESSRLKLLYGGAAQADIDKLEASIETLQSELTELQRTFLNDKISLSDLIHLDVSTGYYFKNPCRTLLLDREDLDSIISYTLEHDQGLYVAKMNTQLAYLSLSLHHDLMSSQYGKDMNLINSYVEQAKQGESVDAVAFQASYDKFLTKIDSFWSKQRRILFFSFTMEWFRGENDGIRYAEDTPYILFSDVMAYSAARIEQGVIENTLEESVKAQFEAIISSYHAYTASQKLVSDLKDNLDKASIRNKMGDYPYEDLKDLQDEYETAQLDMLDTLIGYNQLLYGFNNMTYGAVSRSMSGEDIELNNASGGNQYGNLIMSGDPHYYINSKVEDRIFVLGVRIPEDFELSMDEYELWINGIQIGQRTAIGLEVRHLTLSTEEIEECVLRFYDNGELVETCSIDPEISEDILVFSEPYQAESEVTERVIGKFSYETNHLIGTSMISIEVDAGENIGYYQITDSNGTPIYGDRYFSIKESVQYLNLLTGDFDLLSIRLYGFEKELRYEGQFRQDALTIVVPK